MGMATPVAVAHNPLAADLDVNGKKIKGTSGSPVTVWHAEDAASVINAMTFQVNDRATGANDDGATTQ